MKNLELVLSSNNSHKLKEFKEIFAPYKNVKIYSLKDLDININPDEIGKTFKENSYIKAVAIKPYTDKIIISDDSGLEIDALNGFPGINSSRFMKYESYENKFKEIFKMLENKPRNAQFHCVITLLNLKQEPLYFEGIVRGHISNTTQGTEGFGYDPIFIPDGHTLSFSELGQEEKNHLSHRAIAAQKLIDYLIENKYISR